MLLELSVQKGWLWPAFEVDWGVFSVILVQLALLKAVKATTKVRTDPWWAHWILAFHLNPQSRLSKVIIPRQTNMSPNVEFDESKPQLHYSLHFTGWLTSLLSWLCFYASHKSILPAKLWFMTALKGVIWGFLVEVLKKKKMEVSLCCQITAGRRKLWSFAPPDNDRVFST